MMSSESDWVFFESRDDTASAAMLRSLLEHEGIATRLQVHGVPGLSSFNILGPSDLLQRASSITHQQPPSESELEFLATGSLPSGQSEE